MLWARTFLWARKGVDDDGKMWNEANEEKGASYAIFWIDKSRKFSMLGFLVAFEYAAEKSFANFFEEGFRECGDLNKNHRLHPSLASNCFRMCKLLWQICIEEREKIQLQIESVGVETLGEHFPCFCCSLSAIKYFGEQKRIPALIFKALHKINYQNRDQSFLCSFTRICNAMAKLFINLRSELFEKDFLLTSLQLARSLSEQNQFNFFISGFILLSSKIYWFVKSPKKSLKRFKGNTDTDVFYCCHLASRLTGYFTM